MQQFPNVILIMADQLRADALGCAGNSVVQTPNIDALASGGAYFTNNYVQCPVCMASRGAIHTGRYPRSLRMRSMGLLPPEETTIAETLKRAGYRTGMFGKLHFTPMKYTHQELGSDTPLDAEAFLDAAGIGTPYARLAAEDPHKRGYGFDESVGVEDALWGHYFDWIEKEAPDLLPYAATENWGIGRAGYTFGMEPTQRVFLPFVSDLIDSAIPSELSASRFIVNKANDFIRRNADAPFFMHCSFVDPHHPFNAPAPFNRMYRPEDMEIPPPEEAGRYPKHFRGSTQEHVDQMHGFPNELWQWARSNYYGMISNIDDCVGRMMATLEELGIRDNTIIIFTADHGEFAGGHRLLYKPPLLFDDIMRTTLIFNWPGAATSGSPMDAGARLAGGQVIDDLVQEIDIYPTLMSMLGLSVHGGVQGHDLSSLMAGPEGAPGRAPDEPAGPPWGDPPASGLPGAKPPFHTAAPAYDRVYCEGDDLPSAQYVASAAVRTKDWKLIYYPHAHDGMMFNLTDDPAETMNLYEDPGYAARRNELTAELLDMYDVMKDPLPHRLTQA